MKYATLCSGIEAVSVAVDGMGWEPVFFADIEPFPKAALAHHYPDVPDLGDITKYEKWPEAKIDVLVAGTPCQSFSQSGNRKGMEDDRGKLALCLAGVVRRYRPEWVIWENVTGVLSSSGGRDFGALLSSMADIGYFGSWRVLDAYGFGVPIPRRRVFAVFNPGNWQRAVPVLFQPEAFGDSAEGSRAGPRPHTLSCQNTGSRNARGNIINEAGRWRGMTPVETERALGFPDNYTRIPYRGKPADQCPDGPRYRALGNSMAVPVMRWILGRIA